MSWLMKVVTVALYFILIVGIVFSCIGLVGFTASFFFDLDRDIYRKIVSQGIDTFIPAMVFIMWNSR